MTEALRLILEHPIAFFFSCLSVAIVVSEVAAAWRGRQCPDRREESSRG